MLNSYEKLKLYVANSGNTLCFLCNNTGVSQRFSFLEEQKQIDSQEVKDKWLSRIRLIHEPHNKPSQDYQEESLTPFGGGFFLGRTYSRFAVKKATISSLQNYRSLGDKLFAPALNPNPEVVVIDLEEGDFVFQVTDSIPAVNWLQKIYCLVYEKDNLDFECASQLAYVGEYEDDSTVAAMQIRRK